MTKTSAPSVALSLSVYRRRVHRMRNNQRHLLMPVSAINNTSVHVHNDI